MAKNKKSTQPTIETHGKIDDGKPTMLEQIWGFNEHAKYGTLDESEYEKTLANMNRSDLEAHARKLGVVILESSERLQNKLRQEFKNYILSLRRPANPNKPVTTADADVKKILAEGR